MYEPHVDWFVGISKALYVLKRHFHPTLTSLLHSLILKKLGMHSYQYARPRQNIYIKKTGTFVSPSTLSISLKLYGIFIFLYPNYKTLVFIQCIIYICRPSVCMSVCY